MWVRVLSIGGGRIGLSICGVLGVRIMLIRQRAEGRMGRGWLGDELGEAVLADVLHPRLVA